MYAAAPHEHSWAPHLLSSLFPQLPRADAGFFGFALALGLVLVAALGVARLYPLALLVAAVLLPVLFVTYMYAANIYESKPGLALSATIGWGALVGLVLGLIAKHHGIDFNGQGFSRLGDSTVVTTVFVLPIVGFVASVVAVLVLYRAPRYNEVLDGAAFGATVAVAITSVETIVAATSLLHDGFRAAGSLTSWLVELGEIALLVPVIWAAGAGLFAIALWLGTSVPLRERARTGVFAKPIVATVLGFVFFVAPGVVIQGFRRNTAFFVLIGVALVALVVLRGAIHVGLLEEAEQVGDISDEIECANCHRTTPLDLFCGRCGIALRALPKRRPARRASVPAEGTPA